MSSDVELSLEEQLYVESELLRGDLTAVRLALSHVSGALVDAGSAARRLRAAGIGTWVNYGPIVGVNPSVIAASPDVSP